MTTELYCLDHFLKQRRTKMVTAGSKPGTGFYFCVQCGHRVFLEIGTDRLPPCTKCLGTQYNDKVA
ncbi:MULTISPECIES: zinc ribbon-containing protein [Acinetobacter]|uniref:zinc ribbon-containing protein n=1 Tax=Acinetobacter TaxID=469 RepID=UPI00211EFD47|nr:MULTISPECIES: zinc ribbon-containing protein [Acinetobacter]